MTSNPSMIVYVFLFFFDLFDCPLGFTTLSQKQYPWARFELPSRRHCSEKLGAVALLYLMEKKEMLWQKWPFSTNFFPTLFNFVSTFFWPPRDHLGIIQGASGGHPGVIRDYVSTFLQGCLRFVFKWSHFFHFFRPSKQNIKIYITARALPNN